MGRLCLYLAVFALGLSACIPTRYHVAVNGLGMAKPGASFVVVPLRADVDSTDLQFIEAKHYLITAMREQGYRPADSIQVADVALFLDYGIGEPQTSSYSYVVPVYGPMGGSSTTVTATTSGPDGTVHTSGTVTTAPRYGVVGTSTRTESVTMFTRHIIVSAVDLPTYRARRQIKENWRTVVVSTGTSGDLRRVLPVLFAAADPYLGKDTGHVVDLTIKEGDPRISAIRDAP